MTTPRSAAGGRVASRLGVAVALATAVLSAVGVWVCWRVFLATATGQRVDQSAISGAQYGRSRLWTVAEPILSVITVPAIAVVLVSVMFIAVLRHRWSLAMHVAVLMGGANLTTQVLKNWVFTVPDLDVARFHVNSMPSGHTTAAASVAAAVLFVVPPRIRPWAAVLGAVYATAAGVSTLVGQWHRPSDVVAALLVVLFWFSIASALAATGRRRTERPPRQPRPGRLGRLIHRSGGTQTAAVTSPAARHRAAFVTGVVILGASGVVAGIPALTTLNLAWTGPAAETRRELLTAYAGGALGVAAVTSFVFCAALVVRHSARIHRVGQPPTNGSGLT